MKYRNILIAATAFLMTVSCGDILDTDSGIVEFEEDNSIREASDSVYSMLGILNKMQVVAERNALLGDIRSDMIALTTKANTNLQAVANFEADVDNSYNVVSDYYAVINNCNNYIAKADTNLTLKGIKVFKREYVAAKVFRAWAYLQAVQIYGKLPYVTKPIYSESQAQEEMRKTPLGIKELCLELIRDLEPYVDERVPATGGVVNSKYFIPVRVMLGELCLWAEEYEKAATYYFDYLTLQEAPKTTRTGYIRWGNTKDFSPENYPSWGSVGMNVDGSNLMERITCIPLETQPYYGHTSQMYYLYNSDNTMNNGYVSLTPSKQMREIFKRQHYTHVYTDNNNKRDTLSGPEVDMINSIQYTQGDLRFTYYYSKRTVNRDEFSPFADYTQMIDKNNNDEFVIYRVQMIYLHLAEALNRLGYTQTAMAILKYGLYENSINDHIDETERAAAQRFLNWDPLVFTIENTQGIHSRGSGYAECDTLSFVMPMPETALATRQDTIDYQMPLIEELIVEEMALEGAYEGNRYYDLMRVALRRNDPAFLADRVARRNGVLDDALKQKLMQQTNWYLPLRY